MPFYEKRAGRAQRDEVSDQETITAIQAMIAAAGRPALPQKLSRALTLCLARKEKEDFALVWRANAGATPAAARARLFPESGRAGSLHTGYCGARCAFSKRSLRILEMLKKIDRKSTRLNSSHLGISYAVFCLKKKKKYKEHIQPE